jgi:hypothetical protein
VGSLRKADVKTRPDAGVAILSQFCPEMVQVCVTFVPDLFRFCVRFVSLSDRKKRVFFEEN